MLHAHFARALIGRQSARKIIQRDQAHGHVVERHRQPFRIAKGQQHFVRALVARQALLETVLPVVNIPDVDLDMRPALVVAQRAKDFLRRFGRGKRLIVFSEQNERLDGGNQRARFFFRIADLAKNLQSFLVEVQRLLIVAEHVKRIGFRAQTAPQRFLVSQSARD